MMDFKAYRLGLPVTGERVTKWKGRAASIAPVGVGICSGLLLAFAANAQGIPTIDPMVDLGTLGGTFSVPHAVSANGGVIVGYGALITGSTSYQATSWANSSTSPTALGTLGGNFSAANAVSADGSVIVGWSNAPGDIEYYATSWVNGSTTATNLGALGGTRAQATAVSADGSVIVGFANTAGNIERHAVSWINGATSATDLGTLGGTTARANAVNSDGSVIVGAASTAGNAAFYASSWVNGATTATSLGALGGNYSQAYSVSADGSVIVGEANTTTGRHAVSWNNGSTTATDLGTLGGDYSLASAVSADGNVIVGNAYTAGDIVFRATAWVNGSTSATDLGTLGGTYSLASAVNFDGSVIVGYAGLTGDLASHATAWINGATTPTDLGTLGGTNSQATAVSADGSVIVGYSDLANGNSDAFIVKLSFPIQSYSNLLASFGALANDTAVAMAGQQTLLSRLLNTNCTPTGGAGDCFVVSGNLLDTQANGGISSQSAGFSHIIAGHKFSPNLIAGGGFSLGRVRQDGSAFGDSRQTDVSIWSDFSQNSSFSTGLMVHAAIATAHDAETINRGAGFANVVPLTGSADLNSTAVHASLSYGVKAKSGWLLTPKAGLTWIETSRDAYSETTGAFPATFDKLTSHSSFASLGISAQRPIGAKASVSLGAGADIDLSASRVNLSGTSTLPGMTSFDVTDSLSRNRVRPYVAAEYSYNLSDRSKLDGGLQVATPVYGDTPLFNLGVRYTISF
jgi:probable HAF family extracellular repeat protein